MAQGMGLTDLFAGIRGGVRGAGDGIARGAATFAEGEQAKAKRDAEAAAAAARIEQEKLEEMGRNTRDGAKNELDAAKDGLRKEKVVRTIPETQEEESARIAREGLAAREKQTAAGGATTGLSDRERAALRIDSGARAAGAFDSLSLGLPGILGLGLQPFRDQEIGNSLADADKLGGVRNEEVVGERYVRDPSLAKPTKAPAKSPAQSRMDFYMGKFLGENPGDMISKLNVQIPALSDETLSPEQKMGLQPSMLNDQARKYAAKALLAEADAGITQLTPDERAAYARLAADAPAAATPAPPAGEHEDDGNDAEPDGDDDDGVDVPGVGRLPPSQALADVAAARGKRGTGNLRDQLGAQMDQKAPADLFGFGDPTRDFLAGLSNLSSMGGAPSPSTPPSPMLDDPSRIVGNVNGDGKLRGVTPFREGEHVPDMSAIDDLEGLNFSRSRAGKPDVGVAEQGAEGLDDLPFPKGDFDEDLLRQIMDQQPMPQALAGGIENLKGDDVVDDDSGYRNGRSSVMREYGMSDAPEDAQRALLSLLDDSPPEVQMPPPSPTPAGPPAPGMDEDGTRLVDPSLRAEPFTLEGSRPNGGASVDKLGRLLDQGGDQIAELFGNLMPGGTPEAQAMPGPPMGVGDTGAFDPSMMPADPNEVGDDGFVDLSTIGLSGRAAPRMAGALAQAMAELNPAEQALLSRKLQGGGAARSPERQQELYEDDQFSAMAGQSRNGSPVAPNGATDGRHGWTGEFQRGLDQPIDRDVHSGHRGGLGLDLNGLPPRVKAILAKYGIKEINAGHAGHFEMK